MSPEQLHALLSQIRAGTLTPEEGVARLSTLPYEDLGFAKIDHHRSLRTGMPEVIYAAGKTDEQVLAIFDRMAQTGSNVLATRVAPSAAGPVVEAYPAAQHNAIARTLSLQQQSPAAPLGRIVILCAGTSDLPVAEEASVTAQLLGHQVTPIYDVGVAGLHRLLAHQDELREARVIIACAGMEGALPSVVAGLVSAPVIAVPTSVGYGASFGGIAALLGMLNSCSPHIAVVNIDNGFGAACLADAILKTRGRAQELPGAMDSTSPATVATPRPPAIQTPPPAAGIQRPTLQPPQLIPEKSVDAPAVDLEEDSAPRMLPPLPSRPPTRRASLSRFRHGG